MRRRAFISLIAGAAAWPLGARAQQPKRIPKVGVLMAAAESLPDSQARVTAFREGLAALGWTEGASVHLDYRWAAGNSDLMRQQAEEMVALAPDLILANGTGVLRDVHSLTTSIPVVFVLAIDPVGLGYVQSLARPGGNITGFTFMDPELIGKWIGLLHETAPAVRRAGILFHPETAPFYSNFLRELQSVRQPGGIELVPLPVANADEIAPAISALAQTQGSSLVIGPGPLNQVQINAIATLAAQHRLPNVSIYRPFVQAGGLMAYGPDTLDIFRRSADYVDRILKGANPATLPVQQPNKFEFIVNLKAAAALRLTPPQTLLATADEVIE